MVISLAGHAHIFMTVHPSLLVSLKDLFDPYSEGAGADLGSISECSLEREGKWITFPKKGQAGLHGAMTLMEVSLCISIGCFINNLKIVTWIEYILKCRGYALHISVANLLSADNPLNMVIYETPCRDVF